MNEKLTKEELAEMVDRINTALGNTTAYKAQRALGVVLAGIYVETVIEAIKEASMFGLAKNKIELESLANIFILSANDQATVIFKLVKESFKETVLNRIKKI